MKKLYLILPLALILCFMVGCQEKEAMADTFTRDYHGIPATGNKVESSTIIIARIENGKIVEERKEIDVLNVMQQLGMELKPKEGEK